MYRISAVALYAFSLLVILFALARGSPALGAGVFVLAATMGDLRVSRKSTSKPSPKRNLLRRALRRVSGQIVLSAFVLLDIGGLGLALVAPVWLAPWVTINLTALVVGSLNWSEERRLQRESATAMQRQAEKVRAAEQQKLEEREHEAEKGQQAERAEGLRQTEQQPGEGEKRLRLEGKELEAQKQQHTEQAERLRQLEQQLRESQDRLRQEGEARDAQRQQHAEQAERLHQAEQKLREAEDKRRREEEEREAQRLQDAKQAERLRQAERQLREAEERRCREQKEREALKQLQAEQAKRLHQAEQQLREAQERQHRDDEEREARRKSQRERNAAQLRADWWSILGVAPSASKDEIARHFRHRIKQCHPDLVAGLAPEFLELAEEHTKALNEAYENAMRCRRAPPLC